jgi:hypothetical protein
MFLKCCFFLFASLFVLPNISALEFTGRYIEANLKGEFNRSSNYHGDISVIGAVELDNKFKLRGGIALGRCINSSDFNMFLNTSYAPFEINFLSPLVFSLSYIYNGFISYQTSKQTVFPVISYNTSRAGISTGAFFRFTSFFGEPVQQEVNMAFYFYFNFINSDSLIIGAGCGNFGDFHARNYGAYSYMFYAIISLNQTWSLINEIEIMQSGAAGLTSVLFGFSWRTGVRFSW